MGGRAGSSRRGWECHHKAGKGQKCHHKQESQPGDTKCHPSTITSNLRPSSQIGTAPPSPALAGIIKTPRDGCKLLDVFIKTDKSIFLCGIISSEQLHRAPGLVWIPLPALGLCLLPAWIIPGMCLCHEIKACFTPDSAALQPALLRLS